MKISKISLGTAQLGMKYGIANINGKLNFKRSINLLKFAWKNGINTFDTAPTYGNSEKILGKFISSEIKSEIENLTIITKLPTIKLKKEPTFDYLYDHIKQQIYQSIKNLNIDKIPIYLLHHTPDLFLNEGLVIDCLNHIKKEGLIDNFGISVYNPEEVSASLNYKDINIIQVPINIFDHRLIKSGLLKKLKKSGYIIFARSIYLQGLFFILPKNLPLNLQIARDPLVKLRKLANEYNIDIDKLAFLFVRDLMEITSLVIGVERIDQLAKNLKFLKEKSLSNEILERVMEEFNELSEKIVNPSLWNI